MLGKLAFVDVAQNAGFKLEEIKQLMRVVDGADGMADQVRALSHRKLAEGRRTQRLALTGDLLGEEDFVD